MLLGLVIVAGILIVGALVYIGLREDRGRDPLQERLAQFADEGEVIESLDDIELSVGFWERVLIPFVEGLADLVVRFTPQKQLQSTRHLIELAGMTTEPTTFMATRIIVTVALAGVGGLLAFMVMGETFTTGIMYMAGAAAFGFFLPVLMLRSKVSRRQDSIIRSLPDALDLLTICVEAGLGFDMAMGRVAEKWEDDLALAFGRVLREIQLGKLRREALKDMADRMDVPDVSAFVAAITQADQLGVSMSKILRVQSDQMRTKRRQRAQEKAQQAPVKMMIPMVILIFPSIWIVLMGPAVLRVMDQMGSGGAF
jgi:tight adherence protein C